jgi:hypothetical protein
MLSKTSVLTVSLTVLQETSDIQSLRERPKILENCTSSLAKFRMGLKSSGMEFYLYPMCAGQSHLDIHIKACLSSAIPSFASRDHINANLFEGKQVMMI